jgi:hypothetical protein
MEIVRYVVCGMLIFTTIIRIGVMRLVFLLFLYKLAVVFLSVSDMAKCAYCLQSSSQRGRNGGGGGIGDPENLKITGIMYWSDSLQRNLLTERRISVCR